MPQSPKRPQPVTLEITRMRQALYAIERGLESVQERVTILLREVRIIRGRL